MDDGFARHLPTRPLTISGRPRKRSRTLTASRAIELERPVDLPLSLGMHSIGKRDPSFRVSDREVWYAAHTADGPGTLHVSLTDPKTAVAEAWGPGAEVLIDRAPAMLGSEDDPSDFEPEAPFLKRARARSPGLRIVKLPCIMTSLIGFIIQQRITAREAILTHRRLLRTHSETAPGPADMLLPPHPDRIASLPLHELAMVGLEEKRARTLRETARRYKRIEEARDMAWPEAERRLRAFKGIGVWTAGNVLGLVLGCPDAVIVGDYHMPDEVAWVLAKEPRADDARMLELLEPYRPHRWRVMRLIHEFGDAPPRYGPRTAQGPGPRWDAGFD